MAREHGIFYGPTCLKTPDSKDKGTGLCNKLLSGTDLSPDHVKRKIFTESPLRKVTAINFRTRLGQFLILSGLVGMTFVHISFNSVSNDKESEIEFTHLQRASEMIKIIIAINDDLRNIYDMLPYLFYDVSGIQSHRKAWSLTAEKILFDIESADHVDAKTVAKAMVRPRGWDIKLPVESDKTERATPCWMEKDMFCIPRFYFMGFPYSRANDIFSQLQSHDKMKYAPPQFWWTKVNFKVKISIVCKTYGRVMRNASEDSVLGEVDDMQILHMMNRIPDAVYETMDWHKSPAAPRLMTPYMISAMYPNIKLVIVLQNPIDAVYLAFLNANNTEKRSAQLFHYRAVQMTNLYNTCFQNYNIRACVYDPLLSLEGRKAEVPLNTQFQAVVIGDWLQVLSMEYFHFFKLEDYQDDKRTHLDNIYKFLGVNTPDWKSFEPVKETSLKVPGDLQEPMWPQTRDVLKQFFKPHLIALSGILDSDAYLWGEYTLDEMTVT